MSHRTKRVITFRGDNLVESSMETNRTKLEANLSDKYRKLAKKYRWKLMRASVEYGWGPNWEKTKHRWRKLVLDAYRCAANCLSLARKDFVKKFTEKKAKKSSISVQENTQRIAKEIEILEDLFKGSGIFLYEEHYNAVLSGFVSRFEGALKQSVEDAEEVLDDLYLNRCILPSVFYIDMKYKIESEKAEIRGEDLGNPETLFSIGLAIKENADKIWQNAKQRCRDFDEWLTKLHLLCSLYKASGKFLLDASEMYKKRSKTKERLWCLEEEYSADEFAADCYAGVCRYGMSYFLAILNIFSALKEGVESGKRAILFSYSAVPRLPKFVYDSMNEFVDEKMNETNLPELFIKEFEKIVKKNLDESSTKLFEEARLESKKDDEDYFAISISERIDKSFLDMICCPSCKSELNLVELTRKERVKKGIDGLLVCKNIRCGKKYPIEYGIVKWGIDVKCAPLALY